jgi:hypothetical protein
MGELFIHLCIKNYNSCIPERGAWVQPIVTDTIGKMYFNQNMTRKDFEKEYMSIVSGLLNYDESFASKGFEMLMEDIDKREHIIRSAIKLDNDIEEFKSLEILGIDGFPKTFQTFQKHKLSNSDKYKHWINERGLRS